MASMPVSLTASYYDLTDKCDVKDRDSTGRIHY